MCIVFHFDTILLYSIWNKKFQLKKFQFSEKIYFLKKIQMTPIPGFPVSLQCHRLSTVIHRQWREPVVELNISWNVITTWLTRFQRNAFYGPEINGYPIVCIGDLTFEIRAWPVRHVIRTRENSRLTCLNKPKPSSSRQSYIPSCHNCVELAIFVGKCAT